MFGSLKDLISSLVEDARLKKNRGQGFPPRNRGAAYPCGDRRQRNVGG